MYSPQTWLLSDSTTIESCEFGQITSSLVKSKFPKLKTETTIIRI